jgi:DNA repair exonuclease SbcCD ATPase subunit
MKIHSVKLENVRHLKELSLDLSAPLTVIGGPNGAGKTTLQESILAAMFCCEKAIRDSFVSQFDPDSTPTVTLGLSRAENAATIVLIRSLRDDKGEWREGGTVFKKKKQALEKIEEVLPISADAAALLLWGRQDDMPAVMDSFPSDGHTLLTKATIQGAGPDPKAIIDELEKESDHARKGERGGQVVGPLIQARKRQTELEEELGRAARADGELRNRRQHLQEAKQRRDQLKEQVDAAQARMDKLIQLEQLLDDALKQIETRDDMLRTRSEWESLEGEIAEARKNADELQKELDLLLVQHRVARDEELGRQIEALQERIDVSQELDAACAEIANDLQATRRPERADVEKYHGLQNQINQAQAKLEATGVRYEVSATARPRSVRLAEDGQPSKEITLAVGQSHKGIVGRLTLEADGLCFSAAGKADVSGLKEIIQKVGEQASVLLQGFGAESESDFRTSADEKDRLQQELARKRADLRQHLAGATVAGLKVELERAQQARVENKMTLEDREKCDGKALYPAVEIRRWCDEKRGEIREARDGVAGLEAKRPTDAEKNVQQRALEAIRTKAREAMAAFSDVDDEHREPTQPLGKQIRGDLQRERDGLNALQRALVEAEKQVAELQGQLKQTQPHRTLDAIQADLEEAKEACNREETLQEARTLLAQRIAEKMDTLAAHVPVELGNRVTEHLACLTKGTVGQVALSPELVVTHLSGHGAATVWQPGQLSYGEQHQAALAVKVAVARALAETAGPVFIILDDSLVTFDPQRRAAAEDFLLDLVADGKLQVVLLTCHTDWATDWHHRQSRMVNYFDLPHNARYYDREVMAASPTPRG